jgi:hypothetical protein
MTTVLATSEELGVKKNTDLKNKDDPKPTRQTRGTNEDIQNDECIVKKKQPRSRFRLRTKSGGKKRNVSHRQGVYTYNNIKHGVVDPSGLKDSGIGVFQSQYVNNDGQQTLNHPQQSYIIVQNRHPSFNVPNIQNHPVTQHVPQSFLGHDFPSNTEFKQVNNGLIQGDNGFKQVDNGFRQGDNGFRHVGNGFIHVDNGFRQGENGFRQVDNGFRQGNDQGHIQIDNGHKQNNGYKQRPRDEVPVESKKYVKTITITKEVAVPIPKPYPVPLIKKVPVPVSKPIPVPVDKPYPVYVPYKVLVPVIKHVPIHVEKRVPYKVQVPVKVPVAQPVPVHVPKPIPYTVHIPIKVPIPHHYPVSKPVVVNTHDEEEEDEQHDDLTDQGHQSQSR